MAFRVYLRALEPEDAETSIRWRNDEDTWELLGGRRYYVSLQAEREWLARAATDNASDVRLAICTRVKDQYIGNVSLRHIDWFNRTAEFSILIGDKASRGQGYGREATLLMLRHAFFDLGLERVSSRVLTHNVASIRMHESCGFVREGTMRRALFKNGAHRDLCLMGVLRNDFERLCDGLGCW